MLMAIPGKGESKPKTIAKEAKRPRASRERNAG
jgi:hypothetical protein